MKTRTCLFAALAALTATVWTAAAEDAAATPPPATTPAATEPVVITPEQAKDNIGKMATVTGKVASAIYLERSKSKPTLLNLDKAHPDEIFTVVIPNEARGKFKEAPEKALLNKTITVTGKIVEHKGTPQIQVDQPDQITVVEPVAPEQAEAPAEK